MNEKLVFKLGGDFFDPETIKTFFQEFIKKYKENNILFVVSAMKGVTRLLRFIFTIKTEKNINYEEFKGPVIIFTLNEFQRVHRILISALFKGRAKRNVILGFDAIFRDLCQCVSEYKEDTNNNYDEDKFYAKILQFGELSSSFILSSYINNSLSINSTLFDARNFVEAEGSPREAKIKTINPDFEKLFLESSILITQGFIAKNAVLGFDGSDYSAAMFANVLSKNNHVILKFWKNVRGIFDSDPNKNPDANFIPKITKDEYIKLVFRNGYVVRIDSIQSLYPGIETWVCSFSGEYFDNGTLIVN